MYRRFILLIVCVLGICVAHTTQATALETRIVVQWDTTITRENIDHALAHVSARLNTDAPTQVISRSFREKTHLSILTLTTDNIDAALDALNQEEHVRFAHHDIVFSADAQSTPWGIDDTGVNAIVAHDAAVTGNGVVVAILDSGADLNHEDLVDNLWRPTDNTCVIYSETVVGGCPHGGYDISNDDNSPQDDNGHGTHVAGIIGARNNSVGVVGVAPEAQLMIVKVLDNTGYGSYTSIIDGVQFALDNGADIINLSLGSMYDDQVPQNLLDSIQAAEDAGVLVVAAAGNNASPVPYLPAQFGTVLSVGAVQQSAVQHNPDTSYNTRLAFFSNWGKINVVAPGVRINSTTYDGSYSDDTWEGTSMAAPAVSGVAALLLSVNPTLTPSQLRFVLQTTATDLGTPGYDDFFGAGLIQAEAALAALESTETTIHVEPVWSENSFEDMGFGYYDTTAVYSGRLPSDGTTASTVRIQVRTANGLPIENIDVGATISSGTITSTLPLTTDSNGTAYLDIVSDDTPGIASLIVNIGMISTTTQLLFADTLFVHDNGQPEEIETDAWATTRALEELGVYWMQSTRVTPHTSTELPHYTTVIWNSGTYALNVEEQGVLVDFLRNNGHLIFFGGNALSTYAYYYAHDGASILSIDDLFAQYLGVSFVASHARSNTLATTGALGDLEIESTIAPDDTYAFDRTDVLAARPGSTVLGYYCDNAEDAIIMHEDGYRAITVATTLDLFEAEDRSNLLERLLNTAAGESNSDIPRTTCAAVDDGTTQEDHSANDLTIEPDILSTEVDMLTGLNITLNGTALTMTWNDSASYRSSSAVLLDTTTRELTTAEGDDHSITVGNVYPGATYILAIGVNSTHTLYNPYYFSIAIDATPIHDLQLSKKNRKSLTVTTSTTLSTQEQFEYQLLDAHDTVLQSTISTASTLRFSGLAPLTSYHIRARSVGSASTSSWSEILNVKTARDQVKRPILTRSSDTTLSVTWNQPHHSKIDAYRVELYKKIAGEYVFVEKKRVKALLNESSQSTVFTTTDPHRTYRVRVRAVFHNGDKGEYSRYRRILPIQQ